MSAAPRAHDLVLWGATGFTGRLVAEYLVRALERNPGPRLALGGRNLEKLTRVRANLAQEVPAAAQLPLVIAEGRSAAELEVLVRNARVVVSTVGPFSLHGRELVAACAKHGTHYCDITGEVAFIRQMIDAHHAAAELSGARIVHCCGFDSIPSDLGVLMLQQHLQKSQGHPCPEVRFVLTHSRGGVSGGTLASGLNFLEESQKDPTLRRLVSEPYGLVGAGVRGPDGRDQRGVRWDGALGGWTGPFVMAGVNSQVVRRSNALMGHAYGKEFRYSEVVGFSSGPAGWLQAAGLSAATVGFFAVASSRVGRALLRPLLPKPGAGPSVATRERGSFSVKLFGLAEAGNADSVVAVGEVRGKSDPGYSETAKMLGESALCLWRKDAGAVSHGGVLTPAAALGMPLLARLQEAGMTFEVRSLQAKS